MSYNTQPTHRLRVNLRKCQKNSGSKYSCFTPRKGNYVTSPIVQVNVKQYTSSHLNNTSDMFHEFKSER